MFLQESFKKSRVLSRLHYFENGNENEIISNKLVEFEISATAYIIGESLVTYQIGYVANRSARSKASFFHRKIKNSINENITKNIISRLVLLEFMRILAF